jgi:ribosomal protein S18 acetylase RimI-like enzyme
VNGASVEPAVLEPVTARAWRAVEEARLGAWRLHASLGASGRINACWALGDSGRPPAAAIAAVEAWYAARDLPARFKLVVGSETDLAQALTVAGYRPGGPTLVMTGSGAGEPHPDVLVSPSPDARFSAVFSGTARHPLDARERLGALERTPAPRGFALAEVDGSPAAIGACAVEPPWVGVFAMRTIPDARGRGLGRRVLESLLAHAASLGATTSWLQVEADNAIARRLYERAGFAEAYAYRYWSRG